MALPPIAKGASVQTRIAALKGHAPETPKSNPLTAVVLPLLLVVALCASAVLPFTIAGHEGMQWARNLTIQRTINASRDQALKTASAVIGEVIAPIKTSSLAVGSPFRAKWDLPTTAYSARSATTPANASPALFSGLNQFFAARPTFAAARSNAASATLRLRRDVADAVAAIGRPAGRGATQRGFVVADPNVNATPIARLGDYRTLLPSAMPKLKNLAAPAYVPDAAALGVRPTLNATPDPIRPKAEAETPLHPDAG